MSGSYICGRCRSRLASRTIHLSKPQWHSKATFISFTKPPSPPKDSKHPSDDNPRNTSSLRPSHEDSAKGKRSGNENRNFDDLSQLLSAQTGAVPGRYSKHLQNLRPVEDQEPGDSSGHSQHIQPVELPIRRVDTNSKGTYLMKLLDNPGNGKRDAWRFFLEHYGSKDSPAFTKPAFQDLGAISRGTVFSKLLKGLITDWGAGYKSHQYPRPSEVVQKFEEVGVMRRDFWADTLWLLTSQILREVAIGSKNNQDPEHLLQELMAIWRLFFTRFNVRQTDSTSQGWMCIPAARTTLNKVTTESHLTRSFERRFSKFAPKYGEDSTVALAALMTFTLFTRQSQIINISEGCRSENFPFVNLIAHILPNANLKPLIQQAQEAISQIIIPEEKVAELLKQLRSASSQALFVIGARKFAMAVPSSQQNSELAEEIEEFLIKRLARAIEKEDIRMVEDCWADAQQFFLRPGSNVKQAIPRRFYNLLLTGLMAIRHQHRAIDAWNEMMSSGLKPTVDTWTAMLTGCQKSKDSTGLEKIWARMVASGVQPDTHTWTIRIHGLLSLGRRDQGLAALDDMGRTWLESTKSAQVAITKKSKNNSAKTKPASEKLTSVPKPEVATINAALTALSRVPNLSLEQKRPTMEKVLQWAGRFGIKPDSVTYNIFLRMALQGGDNVRAYKLLRQMDGEKIQPDVATFTIIVQAAFKQYSFLDLPESEQGRAIFALLDDIESRGLKLNAWVYSTVIDGLLKQHSNIAPIRELLNHMNSRNIPPTPHIYTMLVTHYFARDPPDVDAVDSLWTQLMNTPGTITDNVFFDRLVEGYARCGEVGKMMSALTRMSKAGKNPGWNALTAVLRALVEVNDWTRAKEIVLDVKKGDGLAKTGISSTGTYGQQDFWTLVEELGLNREDGGVFEGMSSEADALSA